jgi:ABC-type nitrate/sulfonate/bicarbonate transport system substrate-binding protein
LAVVSSQKSEARVRIAVPDIISPSYFPAEAAVVLGCFAEQGIQAEVELISPVEKAYAALRDGEIEIVAGSAHSALSAFPRWQGVKLLCAQSQGMYWFLVMRADIGASRGDVSCVKGRKIGAAPWVGMGLRRLLIEAGVDPERDDVAIAPIPGTLAPGVNFGVAAARALEQRIVDGFWANGMGAEIAVRSGIGTLVLDVRRGDGPRAAFNYTMPTLAATDAFIAQRPQEAAASVRAIVETQQILKHDVARSLEVGRRLFPDEADHIVELVRRDLPFYSAGVSEDFIAGMNRFARDLGILDVDVAYSAVVAEQFRDEWK